MQSAVEQAYCPPLREAQCQQLVVDVLAIGAEHPDRPATKRRAIASSDVENRQTQGFTTGIRMATVVLLLREVCNDVTARHEDQEHVFPPRP